MAFNFYLYKARDGLPPINRWYENHAVSLGPAEQVSIKLSALYPELLWKIESKLWLGFTDKINPYLDIMLSEQEPNHCFFIVLNTAPPSAMRKILEEFNLNYVCAPESDDLVDPYSYNDSDRFFAKSEWNRESL